MDTKSRPRWGDHGWAQGRSSEAATLACPQPPLPPAGGPTKPGVWTIARFFFLCLEIFILCFTWWTWDVLNFVFFFEGC